MVLLEESTIAIRIQQKILLEKEEKRRYMHNQANTQTDRQTSEEDVKIQKGRKDEGQTQKLDYIGKAIVIGEHSKE